MRLLVFCGTREALHKFDNQADWLVMCPALRTQFGDVLAAFKANENAKLAVHGRAFLLGWRSPAAIVLFDLSWRYPLDSAETMQALARVEGNLPPIELGEWER